MKNLFTIFTFVCCFISTTAYAGEDGNKALSQFLYSGSMKDRHNAFNIIVANQNKYKDAVLVELKRHSTKPYKIPDALIYLAALLKDQRYIQPLSKLINDTDYSEEHCIYSCPIVFSLAIFSSFTNHSLPLLDNKITAVHDLRSEVKIVKSISTRPEKASKYMKGPAVDKLLSQLETLPLADVINIAGSNTKDGEKRMAAAVVLQSHVTDDKYLTELYWLAIENLPNDASGEYRNAIHWAIYRAEKFRKSKST